MTQIRFVIMAGGKEERWRNHLGCHKHLVKIDGETLIDRTLRLLRERGHEDMYLVAKYSEYDREGVRRVPPLDLENGAVVASQDYWAEDQRTTVLFGDTYFTEAAMDQICQLETQEPTFIGRRRGSRITGCPYQELFGFSLLPENHLAVIHSIEHVKEAMIQGVIRMCAGWSVYRHLQGIGLRNKKCPGNFLHIDDFSEDFDTPDDYERWIERFENRHLKRSSRWSFWRKAS